MILHIPHASTDTLGKDFLCDLELELERMTDIDTDKLFDHPDATRIVFPVSRLVCDVERFEDDTQEEMAARGMGACYTRTAYGEPLRVLGEGEREEILEQYYRPHHQALTNAVEKELEEYGQALIIDCHSFPNTPLPCNINQDQDRPDICIGTDSFHTPQELADKAVKHFESSGYIVKVDNPFSGTLVPMKYYRKNESVRSLMIEVNRDLYHCESCSFEKVKYNIKRFLNMIDEEKRKKVIEDNSEGKDDPTEEEIEAKLKILIKKFNEDSEYRQDILQRVNKKILKAGHSPLDSLAEKGLLIW